MAGDYDGGGVTVGIDDPFQRVKQHDAPAGPGVREFRMPLAMTLMPAVAALFVLFTTSAWPLGASMLSISGVWFFQWWSFTAPRKVARREQGDLVGELVTLFGQAAAGTTTLYRRLDSDHIWLLYGWRPECLGMVVRVDMNDVREVEALDREGAGAAYSSTETKLLVDAGYPVVKRYVAAAVFTVGDAPPAVPAHPERPVGLVRRAVTALRFGWHQQRARYADAEEIREALEYIRGADLVTSSKP